jgi:hypothetical protein
MKTTKWFPADVKPVHVGWYERRAECVPDYTYMAWWSGDCFTTGGKNGLIYAADREWRGLAEKAA